jgi:hypothetical protein
LRKRVEQEVLETLNDESELPGEMEHLFAALLT